MSVRSREGEREEWRSLLVACLKVCSVDERGSPQHAAPSHKLGDGGWVNVGG